MTKKLAIKDAQKLAKILEGKCLSKRYVDNHTNLKWQCSERHNWEATYTNVKRGTWCPTCSTHRGERISRNSFRLLFKKPFNRIRPSWLQLELDGFCEDKKLAFEYNGIEHYQPCKWFNKTVTFKEIQRRDKTKKKKCKYRDITLIVIPYTIPSIKIPAFIIHQLRNVGKCPKIPPFFFKKAIIVSNEDKEELRKIKKIAQRKQGKCLSKVYLGNFYKLKFQCKRGHTWEAAPAYIKGKTGTWCPTCAQRIRLTKEEMQRIAKKNRGKCLSKGYKNNSTKLHWECKKKHDWWATPNNIKRKKWCPICRRKEGAEKQKDSIEHMQRIAKKKGGKCLSRRYVDNHTKLHWQCKEGHKWRAEPGNIKQGHWCPICGIKKRAKSQS